MNDEKTRRRVDYRHVRVPVLPCQRELARKLALAHRELAEKVDNALHAMLELYPDLVETHELHVGVATLEQDKEKETVFQLVQSIELKRKKEE
jgi:hypothetical protein